MLMLFLSPAGGPSTTGCTEHHANRVLSVRIYNQTTLTPAGVESIVEVANQLWARYGVSLDLNPGPDEIAVVLQAGSSSVLSHREPTVLGSTLFSEGHATPYIHLSMDHSEAVAVDLHLDGPPFMDRPQPQRLAILARILGVALAHELGHYVLDTPDHAPDGLLQKSLKPRDFVEADPVLLRLTIDQQQRLCPAPSPARSR